ncbi:mechanosensitive ion channel family protein [Synoicihabitans lomoniglobus]|uniref:Mechanosensitive ion channel family protein n=1 Tax=Synoicihabitans lomoniglobus TaxID=2909285 RepID=A0AAE9ZUC9_9BACT|nr:mechanosensitive ion channel family protein [Opitutaceae bacterium LMO-M01]WED65325.1 mechanosensitive ion channel family protein [Opitutaceae bacterium LMO-M01]
MPLNNSSPLDPSAQADAGSSADTVSVDPLTIERSVSLISEKLMGWAETAITLLPNLILATVLFAMFYAIGAMSSRLLLKLFRRAFDSEAIASLLATLLKIAVVAIGFFVALDLIGLQRAVVSLLAGAGIIGLALGFAFQDLAENLLAGLMLGIRKPFKPGDLIKSQSEFGFVRRLNLRNTVMENFSGQMIYIPNKEIFKNVLENFSVSGLRRIEIPVGVSYGEDLAQVTTVLQEALEGLDFIDREKSVEVFALEFGDSSINFTARYWIKYPDGDIGYYPAIHRGVLAIKEAFDANDITIPFPIRTLDFGIKGGEPLRDALPSNKTDEDTTSDDSAESEAREHSSHD